jgi:ketosteroid isomerase-like protein
VPSANLDLVRSIVTAWERGDWSSAEWVHPEIEMVDADGLAPGSWIGLAGIADGTREILSAYDDYRIIAEEYRELDDGRVLVVARRSGRGKTSGMEIEQFGRGALLFHVRDGKVDRLVAYFDYEHAFADLGLAPEDY